MNCIKLEDKNGVSLLIKWRKSTVLFELEKDVPGVYKFRFCFDKSMMKVILDTLKEVSAKSWSNLEPKPITGLRNDYFEYYDRELDNNGYLSIKDYGLFIERPTKDRLRLYKFNKPKMEGFIYDLSKI